MAPYLHDDFASFHDFVERSPVAEVALYELVSDPAASSSENVHASFDIPLAPHVPVEVRGRSALEVRERSRV